MKTLSFMVLGVLCAQINAMAYEACGDHFTINEQTQIPAGWKQIDKYGVDVNLYKKEVSMQQCKLYIQEKTGKVVRIQKDIQTEYPAKFPEALVGGLSFRSGYIDIQDKSVESKPLPRKNFTSYLELVEAMSGDVGNVIRNQAQYSTNDGSALAYFVSDCDLKEPVREGCILHMNMISGTYMNIDDMDSKLFKRKVLKELE